MDTTIFEEIGFTNAETKIYLALLELGSSTAGPILEKTGLQNSVVHMTLHKLVEKGFVSFIKKGKVKHYQPLNPKNIIDSIEEKKKRFEEILPELLNKQERKQKQEAEIFEGFNGFKNALYELIKDAKKGEEYLFVAFNAENPEEYEKIFKFYAEFEKERKRRGIIVRGIAPKSIKEKYMKRDIKNILFVDIPLPENLNIFQDKVILTPPYKDKQFTFLIQSQELADSFRKYWYGIYKKYQK